MDEGMQRRKTRGRPALPLEKGKRYALGIRTTKELKDLIQAAADSSGRSVAQEIEFRLDQSFREEKLQTDVVQMIREAKSHEEAFEQRLIAALREAADDLKARSAAFEKAFLSFEHIADRLRSLAEGEVRLIRSVTSSESHEATVADPAVGLSADTSETARAPPRSASGNGESAVPAKEEIRTLAEMAAELRFTPRRLRAMIGRRGIPVLRDGRDIRFDAIAVRALEDAIRCPSAAEKTPTPSRSPGLSPAAIKSALDAALKPTTTPRPRARRRA